MLTLKEFLDDNSHRCYPFAEVSDLPTDLIVDAHLLVTNNVSADSLVIERVDVTDTHIKITASNNGEDIGTLLACAIPTTDYQTVSCKLVNDENRIIIEGNITFGLVETLKQKTGSYSGGKIFEGCVIPVTEWCTGLVINGVLYTGLVSINIGEGLSVNTSGNSIQIYTNNYEIPEANAGIISDDKLIEEITQLYESTPLRTINGVHPDDSGNIEIKSGSDTLAISNNSGGITITYKDGKTCADAPVEVEDNIVAQIEQLFDNLVMLNERAGALDKSVQTLDTNLNVISAQMAMVQ